MKIMESSERNELFAELNNSLHMFPDSFCKHKILPQLLNAFEFGGAGSAILAPLFRMGKLLNDAEYQGKIVPCVVKLFSSNDRATRLKLLQQVHHILGDDACLVLLYGFLTVVPPTELPLTPSNHLCM